MKRFKGNSFTKKIFVMVLALMLVSVPLSASARAGGGHSSSGHSSGGHSSYHSSSNHSSNYDNYGSENNNGSSSLLGSLILFAIFIGPLYVIVKLVKNNRKDCTKTIENLSEEDNNWNFYWIKRDIEETFYKVQLAWTERNQDLAKDFMSDYLYKKHKLQIEDMRLRNEKNILKNVTLLESIPVGLEDHQGIENDCIWVEIRASAIDYTINEETNQVIKGDINRTVCFGEFWKFIRRADKWVLDEIRQLDEMHNLDILKVKIDNKY